MSGSLPKSLAHLVIREDPETGDIIEPTSSRRVSVDQFKVSPRGEPSRLTRDTPYISSAFSSRDRPSLPPLRLREDIFAQPRQARQSRTPPRPQTSVSPPLLDPYHQTQREHYHVHPSSAQSYAYVPRSAPPVHHAFDEESTHHSHGPVHPHLPRRHSHQPYARPVTAYQPQPYIRPSTSTFESYHPSSEIGNLGGRGPISRTTKACDTCRTRKIRCEDGPMNSLGEPGPCMRCLAAGIECVFSGVQKKRGPCPGTTRPTTSSATVRRSSSTSDRAEESVSVSPQTRPFDPRHIQPPVPSSARSSIGSINTPRLLTPPEDRRSSYGFSTSPASTPRQSISNASMSAPIVPTALAHWPVSRAESPETHSTLPRLPAPTTKSGRSLFDADYHLGLRLPSIDFARSNKKAAEDQLGPTGSTLKPILNDSRSTQFWQGTR